MINCLSLIVNGEWWMVNGGWWMVDGGWWMVDGEYCELILIIKGNDGNVLVNTELGMMGIVKLILNWE